MRLGAELGQGCHHCPDVKDELRDMGGAAGKSRWGQSGSKLAIEVVGWGYRDFGDPVISV